MSRDSTSRTPQRDAKLLIISADCHAGALPSMYEEYLPKAYHEDARRWWIAYAREMMARTGTFFDQEAIEAYDEKAGEGGRDVLSAPSSEPDDVADEEFLRMLSDESNAFAPRRGEFDAAFREQELNADGVAAEVIFPQMAPFGAGLTQYRRPVKPDHNLEGIRAYNRWLSDFCKHDPARHAGIALINVDDIEVTVDEIRAAKALGLWGVLLPTSTGEHPFYHDPRYEPIWAVCEELEMPLHSHSGWSPDYGDAHSATAMYISEVATWAQRPFAALMWSGAFERHERLRFILTETGCSWILETLRVLEMHADNPIFKYFTKGLSLRPSEYFARQCYLGASFMSRAEGEDRHRIGVERLMWGTDYPHLEGTWPDTMKKLRETFCDYPEGELRAILGDNASAVYGFDLERLAPLVEEIGPSVADIRGEA